MSPDSPPRGTPSPPVRRDPDTARGQPARASAKSQLEQDRRCIKWGDRGVDTGIAVASAGGGALLDSLINSTPGWGWGLGMVLAGLPLTIAARRWRGKAQDRITGRGTLYYVRLLDPGMQDRRLELFEGIRKNYGDVRAVTRWITSRPTQGTSLPAIDVTHDVNELSRDLQLTMNEDSNDTSFTLAPNMLWPMALGVGFATYLFHNTKLGEIPMSDEEKSFPDFDVVQCADWEGEPGSVSGCPQEILVVLDITGVTTLPAAWEDKAVRVDLGTGEGLRLVKGGPGNDPSQDPNRVASLCAKTILTTLAEHPAARVVLVARLPKSVALLLGWRLGQKLDAPKPFNPWERLVTVQLQPPSSKPVVTRVHPSQPPLEEMIAVTQRLYDASPGSSGSETGQDADTGTLPVSAAPPASSPGPEAGPTVLTSEVSSGGSSDDVEADPAT